MGNLISHSARQETAKAKTQIFKAYPSSQLRAVSHGALGFSFATFLRARLRGSQIQDASLWARKRPSTPQALRRLSLSILTSHTLHLPAPATSRTSATAGLTPRTRFRSTQRYLHGHTGQSTLRPSRATHQRHLRRPPYTTSARRRRPLPGRRARQTDVECVRGGAPSECYRCAPERPLGKRVIVSPWGKATYKQWFGNFPSLEAIS